MDPLATIADAQPDGAALAHADRLRRRVEEALAGLDLPREPRELYEPVRYVLGGGGKRLRPVLLLLAAEAAAADVRASERALPAALAAEVFHNFTLVHDDIMDHAAERRGRPTVHVVWDESTALLVGDYLLGLAYALLGRTETDDLPALLQTFSTMVARVCEGQALDEAFEERDDVALDDYLRMIAGKTGALLECVLELGGRIGGAEAGVLDALRRAGRALGLAFQIQDDLLDLTAEAPDWGKTIGGDLREGKKTYLVLLALERARGEDLAWFRRVVRDRGLPEREVPEARARMERLGVLEATRQAVHRHCAEGLQALGTLPASPAREALLALAARLASRAR